MVGLHACYFIVGIVVIVVIAVIVIDAIAVIVVIRVRTLCRVADGGANVFASLLASAL